MKLNKFQLGLLREMQANPAGSRHAGKHNEHMNDLRKLGLVKLDKSTCAGFGERYNPTWYITDAGREALIPARRP